MRRVDVLLGMLALACFTPAASAAHLVAADPAPPVPGWTTFCEKHASECAVDLTEPDVVSLDDATLRVVSAVNSRVNRAIAPRSDLNHWSKVDQWDLPTDGEGDCEDYQLFKRKLLVEAGLPRRAMRMTVVIDHTGEGHAVLLVQTNKGDLVLDNTTDAVLPTQDTKYEFIKRESTTSSAWVFLRHTNALVVADARQ